MLTRTEDYDCCAAWKSAVAGGMLLFADQVGSIPGWFMKVDGGRRIGFCPWCGDPVHRVECRACYVIQPVDVTAEGLRVTDHDRVAALTGMKKVVCTGSGGEP